jgi:acetylornithine deacetylase
VNAIDVACELVRFLGTLADEARAVPCAIKHMHPPYTTINVGVIDGGQQFNIVPGECRFSWDIRPVPGQDPHALVARLNDFAKTLLPAMRDICAGAGIETVVTVGVPAFEPRDDSEAESLVKHLAQTNESGSIAFGTEAPCYQQAGMSVVVFGPGSIEQAHKPDEYLSVDQLEAGVGFVRALMSHLSQ